MGCGETLFLAEGGHVTCSWHECPEPAAVDQWLREDATPGGTDAVQTMIERCVCEHGRWAHAEKKGRCFAQGCPCQAFAPTGDDSPLAPEIVRLASRFTEGAQMLEQAAEGNGEKARRKAQRLADGMRLQAITVALGLETPRG